MSKKLAAALAKDDKAEDAGMHPDDRTTCHAHQGYADNCADDEMHTNPTRHVLRGLLGH